MRDPFKAEGVSAEDCNALVDAIRADERKRVVTWLRREADMGEKLALNDNTQFVRTLQLLANAIERGEHAP